MRWTSYCVYHWHCVWRQWNKHSRWWGQGCFRRDIQEWLMKAASQTVTPFKRYSVLKSVSYYYWKILRTKHKTNIRHELQTLILGTFGFDTIQFSKLEFKVVNLAPRESWVSLATVYIINLHISLWFAGECPCLPVQGSFLHSQLSQHSR